jgi:hypothetical protein
LGGKPEPEQATLAMALYSATCDDIRPTMPDVALRLWVLAPSLAPGIDRRSSSRTYRALVVHRTATRPIAQAARTGKAVQRSSWS